MLIVESMLMDDSKGRHDQEQITETAEGTVVFIRNAPVMQVAVNVLSLLGNKGKIILHARGNSIPNAVAVANIITEKMMRGNSKVDKIILDSEIPIGMGRMISTIKITLNKI